MRLASLRAASASERAKVTTLILRIASSFRDSAGTQPGEHLNPAVVEAMSEVGIDITSQTPTKLTEDMAKNSDVIVTMGCGDECPYYPGKRYDDWPLDDPAGQPLDVVRRIRDDIQQRVQALVTELKN